MKINLFLNVVKLSTASNARYYIDFLKFFPVQIKSLVVIVFELFGKFSTLFE